MSGLGDYAPIEMPFYSYRPILPVAQTFHSKSAVETAAITAM